MWEALSKVWESISELEETPWSTAVPRKIRKALDAVQEGMRNLPNRVRQYEPFDHAQVMVMLSLVVVVVVKVAALLLNGVAVVVVVVTFWLQ